MCSIDCSKGLGVAYKGRLMSVGPGDLRFPTCMEDDIDSQPEHQVNHGSIASKSGDSSLSVIIPVFNGEGWIGRCLKHLAAAIHRSELSSVEVLLVDDGSTDNTLAEAGSVLGDHPYITLNTFSQPNSGRFAARRLGLAHAQFEFVLFIDTRVFISEDALEFVIPRLKQHDQAVWTSHVEAATASNPIAGFWAAIEHVAWRRYFKRPTTTQFGIADFDYFPKGTTAFIAPRALLIDAFDAFEPTVYDWHKVNDDTAVLRWVAERTPINISPHYASIYNARTTVPEFLKHAEHRGTVFIDGYLRRGTRFFIPILAVLVTTPAAIWFALRHPFRFLSLGLSGSVIAGMGAKALGARSSDARVLAALSMPFGVAYLAGMWRGVLLRFSWIRRGDTEQG